MSTSTPQQPQRKRKRVPSTATSSAPLSAIAKRKLAAAAAASLSAAPIPAPAPPSPAPKEPSPEPEKEFEAAVQDVLSSEEEETPAPAEKGKKKKAKGKASRYFAGEEWQKDELAGGEDVVMVEREEEIAVEEEEDDVQVVVQEEEEVLPAPQQGRRRKNKSSYHDSASISTWTLSPTHNLYTQPRTAASPPSVLLGLLPSETFIFSGLCTLTVLSGTLSLLGAHLRPNPSVSHPVYAPRSHPLPVLQALDAPAASARARKPSADIPTGWEKFAVVLRLEELSNGVEGWGKACPPFAGSWDDPSGEGRYGDWGIKGFFPILAPTPNLTPYLIPPSWSSALASLPGIATSSAAADEDEDEEYVDPPVALVRGPKNTGKSSFARALVNRLLSRFDNVAFLECDIGQSEFTPSGMVALNLVTSPLFGPPPTHPSLPYRAHFIGSTSPTSSSEHYLSSVHSLLSHVPPSTPLVINTQGWVRGLGASQLSSIGSMLPMHALHFSIGDDEGSFPSPAPAFAIEPVSSPESPLAARYSAADHRALALLSYFHAAPALREDGAPPERWDFSRPLCAVPPYAVDWAQAFDSVHLIAGEDVAPSEVFYTLNGSLVALVASTPSSSSSTTPSSQTSLPLTPDPPTPHGSTTLGLALIRSIHPPTRTLHIVTPVPPAQLARARTLVKGALELPVCASLDWREGAGEDGVAGTEWGRVPYLSVGGVVGEGGARRRVRRGVMRRGQFGG